MISNVVPFHPKVFTAMERAVIAAWANSRRDVTSWDIDRTEDGADVLSVFRGGEWFAFGVARYDGVMVAYDCRGARVAAAPSVAAVLAAVR